MFHRPHRPGRFTSAQPDVPHSRDRLPWDLGPLAGVIEGTCPHNKLLQKRISLPYRSLLQWEGSFSSRQ